MERIGEDEPKDEAHFRDLWEDESERETVLTILQAECEVLRVDPRATFLISPKSRTCKGCILLQQQAACL